jgi:hypothetical protein
MVGQKMPTIFLWGLKRVRSLCNETFPLLTHPSKPPHSQDDDRRKKPALWQRLRLLFLSVRVTDDWAHAGSPRPPSHKLYRTPPMFSGRESPQSLPHNARGRHSGTVPSPADHDGYPVQRWVRQRESRSDDWPKLGQRQHRLRPVR